MTRSAAERTSPRAIPQQSPVSPPPDVGLRGQQLALIDVSGGRGTGQEGLDLPGQIASLERELRYYRRVIPALTRATANPRRASRDPAGELTHLARWLTDGQRVIDSISRTLAEQPQLEIRLEAPSNEPTARSATKSPSSSTTSRMSARRTPACSAAAGLGQDSGFARDSWR
jgi:hypothetical protein